jgi:lipopolysaccharide assembly outer membrane protein LptD (OstA)
MKLIAFAAALLLLVVGFSTAMGQARAGDLKHVTLVSQKFERGPVLATALSVEKGHPYPSVAHLKGNVVIKANGFILHADQADYDEVSGEIKASGNVSVTPYPPLNNR